MAYTLTNSKGIQYFLHQRDQLLKGGRLQRIHFFAKQLLPEKGTPVDEMPVGYIHVENPRTGLPCVKKA